MYAVFTFFYGRIIKWEFLHKASFAKPWGVELAVMANKDFLLG